MEQAIQLKPHPAQARNENDEPMVDADGKPVPLFPDQRSIWYRGQMVGYVCSAPYHRIAFIDHEAGNNQWLVNAVRILVEQEFGIKPDRISNVPTPVADPDQEDED